MLKNILVSIITITMIIGCGVDINHKGTAKGEVNVKVSLDEKIERYFEATCRQQLPPGTPEQYIIECRDAAMGQFLSKLSE